MKMQAIQTKFYGPTNTKGDRIKAWCERGSITIPYSYEGDSEYCHKQAIRALVNKFILEDSKEYGADSKTSWSNDYVVGWLPRPLHGMIAVFIKGGY